MNSEEKTRLDKILKTFPFRRQNRQQKKLAEYTVAAPGNNKSEIQTKTNISQPTIRKIQSSYRTLNLKDTIFLMEHLFSKLKKKDR